MCFNDLRVQQHGTGPYLGCQHELQCTSYSHGLSSSCLPSPRCPLPPFLLPKPPRFSSSSPLSSSDPWSSAESHQPADLAKGSPFSLFHGFRSPPRQIRARGRPANIRGTHGLSEKFMKVKARVLCVVPPGASQPASHRAPSQLPIGDASCRAAKWPPVNRPTPRRSEI